MKQVPYEDEDSDEEMLKEFQDNHPKEASYSNHSGEESKYDDNTANATEDVEASVKDTEDNIDTADITQLSHFIPNFTLKLLWPYGLYTSIKD